MVFKNPDMRVLSFWEPAGKAYSQLVAHWTSIPLNDPAVPPGHRTTDVIRGFISVQGDKKHLRVPGPDPQMVFESCRACRNYLH